MALKTCSKCRQTKPDIAFVRSKGRKDGRYPHCKECVQKYAAGWRRRPAVIKRNKAYQRLHGRRPKRVAQIRAWQTRLRESGITEQRRLGLKHKYGLTEDAYLAMWRGQDGRCATCTIPFKSHTKSDVEVDHCHATKKVRGLLCDRCNRVLGFVSDNVDTLRRMIEYLERAK